MVAAISSRNPAKSRIIHRKHDFCRVRPPRRPGAGASPTWNGQECFYRLTFEDHTSARNREWGAGAVLVNALVVTLPEGI